MHMPNRHLRYVLFYSVIAVLVVVFGLSSVSAQTATPAPVDTSLIGQWMYYPIIVRSDGEGSGQTSDLTLQPGIPVTLAVSADGTQLESPGHALIYNQFNGSSLGLASVPLQFRRPGFYSFAIRLGDPADFSPVLGIDLYVVSPTQIDVYEHIAGYEGGKRMRAIMARNVADPRQTLLPYTVCPGGPAPHLNPGETANVDYMKGLNLREQPDSKSKLLAPVKPFSTVQVLDGPACGSNMAYWKVTVDGKTGWLSEGSGTDYWLDTADGSNVPEPFVLDAPVVGDMQTAEVLMYRLNSDGSVTLETPLTVAVEACPNGAAPQLRIGGKAYVLPGDPNALNTKPAPHSADPTSQRLALIPSGVAFDVLDGPVCANDITWWKVNYQGVIGWTGEMQGTTLWVAPAP